MKIVVTGGTGFTGRHVLPLLKGRGDIRCVIRNPSNASVIKCYGFEPFVADIRDAEKLREAMDGQEGLIHIVSLGFGDADRILDAAVRGNIRRGVFVSTTAVTTRLHARSKAVRLAAEEEIKRSPIIWTILRPTMIYGTPGDRNLIKLIRFLEKSPFVPVPGDGSRMQQPVHVEDVARGIVDAFFSDRTGGKTYNLSGATPLTFNDLIETTCRAMGVRRRIIHIPVRPVTAVLRWLEKATPRIPIREEQVLRLLEDKSFSHDDAARDFGFAPIPFEHGIRREVDIFMNQLP